MTKAATNYDKCYIYKIYCKDINIKYCYIGHTVDIIDRKSYHKCSIENPNYIDYNEYKYCFIRDNGGWENWIFEIIEVFSCNNQKEAENKEQYYINQYDYLLNKVNPVKQISKQQYNKKWYEGKKIKIRQEQNDKYKNNKELQLKARKRSAEYQKTKGLEIINCPFCNVEITRNSLSRHKKQNKKCLIIQKDIKK
jgi:hypothetical protein